MNRNDVEYVVDEVDVDIEVSITTKWRRKKSTFNVARTTIQVEKKRKVIK
jgi:hypothetical protein